MSLPRKPIRVYESAVNSSGLGFLSLITQISDYISLRFKQSLYTYGDFEIVVNAYNDKAAELLIDRYIIINREEDKTGIIKSVEKRKGEDASQELLIVRGYEAKFILGQRLILPPSTADLFTLSDDIETGYKEIVKDCVGTDAIASRQMTLFDIVATSSRGPNYKWDCRNVSVLTEFDKAAVRTGVGYKVTLDASAKKRLFDVIVGTDRTASVILSSDLHNIASGTYVENTVNKKTVAYVAGQGQGKNRTVRTVYDGSEPTGDARKEALVDARELLATADIDAKGAEFLIEADVDQYIELIASSAMNRKYNTDYFLGDTITLEDFGVSLSVIIASAELCVDANRDEYVLALSRELPEAFNPITDKLNIQSRILQNDVRPQVLESVVATGTAPLNVESTTVVSNLNANLWNGKAIADLFTEWTDYTPVFNGLGTCTSINFEWRRVGSNVEIRGRAQCGTPTAAPARIGLPIVSGTQLTTRNQTVDVIPGQGTYYINATTANYVKSGPLLAGGDAAYLELSLDIYSGTVSPFAAQNGNALISATTAFSVRASVPISQWSV
jgi:hypothetical protein